MKKKTELEEIEQRAKLIKALRKKQAATGKSLWKHILWKKNDRL